jgi:preprotein translocase subunit SecF
MSKWKKFTLVVALIAVSAFVFLTWYKFHYSMDVAESFEVTVQNPEHQLLIATQGSDFKNAVVEGVIEALKERPVSINVIDVSGLSSVNLDEWSAVVILHTWESWEPQADARQFLERQADHSKIVVLSTSGAGDFKIDGIDAISTASVMSDVPSHVADIVRRINGMIGSTQR